MHSRPFKVNSLLLFLLAVPAGTTWAQVDWEVEGDALVAVAGAWDSAGLLGPMVVRSQSDYKLYYHSNGPFSVGCAESTDRRNWERCSDEPVLSSLHPWEAAATALVGAMYDETEQEQRYKMWYTGASAGEAGPLCHIGYATSANGVDWQRFGNEPVLAADDSPSWEFGCIGSASVVFVESESDRRLAPWPAASSASSRRRSSRAGD